MIKTTTKIHNKIKFMLNDKLFFVEKEIADTTLLHWLRENQKLTGSKEGCAEGDCGSCSIIIGKLDQKGKIKFSSINACILYLPMIDGCSVRTVEGVSGPKNQLHPVQVSLIKSHGSQCGFCTPGFVISLYSGWLNNINWNIQNVENLLCGNLCRCTGYGPIVEAATNLKIANVPKWEEKRKKVESKFIKENFSNTSLYYQYKNTSFFAPVKKKEVGHLLNTEKNCLILSGGTDIGLWTTKQHKEISKFIYLNKVNDLNKIIENKNGFNIFSSVTHETAMNTLSVHYPALGEIWRRFGSAQVRSSGTVCGNIANGSPIGDLAPAFLSLDSSLILNKNNSKRKIKLDKFFISYGLQDIKKEEWIEYLFLPKLKTNQFFSCYKISKRFDQDISAVMGAFCININKTSISRARVAFGGMDAIPKRALNLEKSLIGTDILKGISEKQFKNLYNDFTPLSDMRGSVHYRMETSINLLKKFFFELKNKTEVKLAGNSSFIFKENNIKHSRLIR